MKNKKYIWIVLGILLVVILSVGLIFIFNNKKQGESPALKDYKLTFHDDYTPGGKYDIVLDKEENIQVTETRFCSAVDCPQSAPKEVSINLTGENKKYAVRFIRSFFEGSEKTELEIYQQDLTEIQLQTLTLLLENRDDLFSLVSEPYEHMISYDNGNKSFFVYQNKDNIKVKRINYSENEEAKDITTYDITFKETNQKIIVDYLEERFKDSKENYFFLDSIDISGKAQFILNSLSYNDESYLEKADKFMFEISNTNVKCPTVYLYIYNDKTYEFYHTFQDGKPVDKKVGTYTKDATSILKNIGTYGKEGDIIYSVKDYNGKKYTVSNSNKELEEFLKDIPENLESCAVYGD